MKNLAVICFFVVGAVVLPAQGIYSDDRSLFEEVLDVEKRQSWNTFREKHIVENREFNNCRKDWNCIGKERFGTHGNRQSSTIILVPNRLDVIRSFDRKPKLNCPGGRYRKSHNKFHLVELKWNQAHNKYMAKHIGSWYICVSVDSEGRPAHFAKKIH